MCFKLSIQKGGRRPIWTAAVGRMARPCTKAIDLLFIFFSQTGRDLDMRFAHLPVLCKEQCPAPRTHTVGW